jgi:hypothetical protein
MMLAPPADGGGVVFRFPGQGPAPRPSPDEHLVQPETTRDEILRGRRLVAMPGLPPHADRQLELGYAVRSHVRPGYVGSTELLTRVNGGSDFATDVCVRRAGDDPETGARYLEELSFEVVNEQSVRDVGEKAEELTARGVRRVIAVFVKTGTVCQWSRAKLGWEELDLDGVLDDPCLHRPLALRALLDAARADDEVARGLEAKHNPAIVAMKAASAEAGRAGATRDALRQVLARRKLLLSPGDEARIEAAGLADLKRWIDQAIDAADTDEALR